MDPLTQLVIAVVIAVGAAGAAVAYAHSRRPWWAGAVVLLTIVALLWGTHALLTAAVDNLIWRLEWTSRQIVR